MSVLFGRYREFSPAARSFLGGAVLIELSHAVLWTLQNLYVRSVGYGEKDAGAVLSATAVGVVVSTFPSTWVYERLGPRKSLSLSCVGVAVSVSALACSESLLFMCLFAMLGGFAFTLHRVVAAPFIVSVTKASHRSHLFQAEFAAHAAAMALGPILGGELAAHLEGTWATEVIALRMTLIAGALTALLAAIPYRRVGDARPPRGQRRGGTFEILKRGNEHLWVRVTLPYLVIGMGAGMTIPFINLYFTDRFALPKDDLGLVMATSSATMVIASLATPWVVSRLGNVRATILTEVLSLPFFIFMAFTQSASLAVGAYVLRTVLMNLSHPIWRHLIMEITPSEWQASVNSMTMLGWNLGWGLANWLGGALIETTSGVLGHTVDGYAVPMMLTMGLYILAIVLEARFFWPHREIGRAPT